MRLGLAFYLNLILIIFTLATVFIVGLFMIGYDPIGVAVAEEDEDITPPKLYNIEIANTNATSTIIRWDTDEMADSLINYGLDKNYGIIREPRFDKTEHYLILENLLPGSDYFFRVTSADSRGNQGISSDYSFRTEAVEEEDRTGVAEEVIEECAAFPYGDHDDLVDSTTQAIMRFRQGGLIDHPEDYVDVKAEKPKRVYY